MLVFVRENRMDQPEKSETFCLGHVLMITHMHYKFDTKLQMVLQAAICPWKTGTALKPRLLRQVGKTQSVLSAEHSKQPIAVIQEKETHMVLWFGCSVDCEPVLSTEWGIGKYLKRKYGDCYVPFILKQINTCMLNTSGSQNWIEGNFTWLLWGASWNYA